VKVVREWWRATKTSKRYERVRAGPQNLKAFIRMGEGENRRNAVRRWSGVAVTQGVVGRRRCV